jgi:uncharacterized protein (TIGR01777 family)
VKFVVAGATGFLGGAFSDVLTQQGHEVVRLVRRTARRHDEARWDPAAGDIDDDLLADADVVANLTGAPLAHVPWTPGYRANFVSSRVDTTRTLAEAIAWSPAKPAFLAQSAVAGYGDRGRDVITEETPIDADSFMADVVREWEAATRPASEAGARVAIMRTAVLLDRRAGALKVMLPAFRLGLGGPIGSGKQYFATISLHDWLRAATYLALGDNLSGPFNLSGPDTATNEEFTDALAQAVHRPAKLRAPGFVLRNGLVGQIAGPMTSELLVSARVEPARLIDAGYAFAHNDINDRIAAGLR